MARFKWGSGAENTPHDPALEKGLKSCYQKCMPSYAAWGKRAQIRLGYKKQLPCMIFVVAVKNVSIAETAFFGKFAVCVPYVLR